MEHGSDKHGPRLDDEMARETQSYQRGAPVGSRTDQWRDPESVSDDEPEPGWIPGGERPGGAPAPLTGRDLEARSRLGRAVPLSALPGDKGKLLRGVEELGAPPDVRADMERLPEGRIYRTVYEIWEALGYANETPGDRPAGE